MRDAQSSKLNAASRLTTFNVVVSSLAAIAGVALAAYQTFAPQSPGQAPVNVVVSMEPQKADAVTANEVVTKTDQVALIATEAVDVAEGATVSAALKDGSDNRYSFSSLFDGKDDTFLSIKAPDEELNILVTFRDGAAHPVTALEYIPPAGVDPAQLATTVDVIVLPEGQLEASGRQVASFTIPNGSEPSTFAIPGRAVGKGLWLRVAGNTAEQKVYVGDFRILSEGLAP